MPSIPSVAICATPNAATCRGLALVADFDRHQGYARHLLRPHVKHWADGGETKLGNLVTLCSLHHTLLHEGGFGVTATDDGGFVFTRPDGSRIAECGTTPIKTQSGRFRGIVGAGAPAADG